MMAKIFNSKPRRRKFHVVELRERFAREREKKALAVYRKRKVNAHKRFIAETEYSLSDAILRYHIEMAFCRGWRKMTEGMIYSQGIIDAALTGCQTPEVAYLRGVDAGNMVNNMYGKTSN